MVVIGTMAWMAGLSRGEKMIPRDYDMLTTQEKRSIAPFASEYLAEELAKQEYAHKRRKQIAIAIAQEENEYEEEIET